MVRLSVRQRFWDLQIWVDGITTKKIMYTKGGVVGVVEGGNDLLLT